MGLAAPFWLLLFLPWVALLIWLLPGRRLRQDVPFLNLWQGPAQKTSSKRARVRPPWWILLALLAAASAILAAAHPYRSAQAVTDRPMIAIVLDRGIAMSAMDGGVTRYARTAAQAAELLKSPLGGSAPIDLFIVPSLQGPRRIIVNDLASEAAAIRPTALQNGPVLAATISEALQSAPAVLVLTDEPVNGADGRVDRLAPAHPISDVAIESIAVEEHPHPQAMVLIRNNSAASAARLNVDSGSDHRSMPIALPGRGESRSYFVDLATVAQVITTTLDISDDLAANNVAALVRQGHWPRLLPGPDLAESVARVIEIYQHQRPPDESSASLRIGRETPPSGEAGILIAQATTQVIDKKRIELADHPITHGLDFSSAQDDLRRTEAAPPAGFTPIVTIGGAVIAAASDSSVRQVWIGFESEAFARTPDFVLFWSHAIDWAGNGGTGFAARALASAPVTMKMLKPLLAKPAFEPGCAPGLYEDRQGRTLAYVAAPITARPESSTAPGLSGLSGIGLDETIDLRRLLASFSVLAVLLSVLALPRRRG